MVSERRQIVDDKLYVHFITFSVDHRRKLFELQEPNRILLSVLNEELNNKDASCAGFVIMPEHVHALIQCSQPGELSRFMHAWKRHSSFLIRKWYRENAPNYSQGLGETERFWTPKYYSFEIASLEKLHEKLKYVHENPVRAKLVHRAIDWPWSSARWYESREQVGVPITPID